MFNVLHLAMSSVIVLSGQRATFSTAAASRSRGLAISIGVETGFWLFFIKTLRIFGLLYGTAIRIAFVIHLCIVIVLFAAVPYGIKLCISFTNFMASLLSFVVVSFLLLDGVKTFFTLFGVCELLAEVPVGAFRPTVRASWRPFGWRPRHHHKTFLRRSPFLKASCTAVLSKVSVGPSIKAPAFSWK